MNQLKQIEQTLEKAGVPQDVHIGTNSTPDRVEWLAARCELKTRTAARQQAEKGRLQEILAAAGAEVRLVRSQFSGSEELVDALETLERMVTTVEVVKMTSGGREFYCRASEMADAPVGAARVVTMSEQEYREIPATEGSRAYFSGAGRGDSSDSAADAVSSLTG